MKPDQIEIVDPSVLADPSSSDPTVGLMHSEPFVTRLSISPFRFSPFVFTLHGQRFLTFPLSPISPTKVISPIFREPLIFQ